MTTDKPNNIPRPKIIARHFSQGKVCDYPAEAVLSAVNAYDFGYHSITIPIKIGFEQMFNLNIDAFIYLSQHRSEAEFQKFLLNPNAYMANVGVILPAQFDEVTPRIIVAMLEDELLDAIKSDDIIAVIKLLGGIDHSPWIDRHPERFPSDQIMHPEIYTLNVSSYDVRKKLEDASIPGALLSDLSFIAQYFTQKD